MYEIPWPRRVNEQIVRHICGLPTTRHALYGPRLIPGRSVPHCRPSDTYSCRGTCFSFFGNSNPGETTLFFVRFAREKKRGRENRQSLMVTHEWALVVAVAVLTPTSSGNTEAPPG